MLITVHLSDGRKITKDDGKLIFVSDICEAVAEGLEVVKEGCITINCQHVVDMRPADEMEKMHAEIHGW